MQNEVLNFDRKKLKKTSTKITFLSGRRLKEDIYTNENEELNESNHNKSELTIEGYVIDLVSDVSCNEIVPNLFLSGADVATDIELLKSKFITHIVNCTSTINNMYEKEIKYLKVPIDDLPNVNILKYFNEAFEFIDNALLYDKNGKNNNVLVHCHAGVSRSASIIIGYLLKKRLFVTYRDAYEHVKSSRPIICPNPGFVTQLKHYEYTLFKQNA